MKNRASITAIDVLAARAIATIAPVNRRIMSDPLAADLLPWYWFVSKVYFKLGRLLPWHYHVSHFISSFVGAGGATLIALRHRCIDDRLARACEGGVAQVVILGAGYDSRAVRLAHADVAFVEIDHPHTQKNKIRRLKRLLGTLPAGVRHVAVDFRHDWIGTVRQTGAIRAAAAFFIWEGVSYYLPAAAVHETLDGIMKIAAPGSVLIFDAYPREIANAATIDRRMKRLRRYGALRGEPFLWGCDRDEICGLMEGHGFTDVSVISMGEFARDLAGHTGLRIRHHGAYDAMYIVEARVPHAPAPGSSRNDATR